MTLPSKRRVVVVTRPSELEELLAQHGTRDQARFFLAGRGLDLDLAEEQHHLLRTALQAVAEAIPLDWRRARVVRGDLDRFLFEPDDLLVVVGQDGLVANVAKYLAGQPVVGINPDAESYDGILVPHPPDRAARLLRECAEGDAPVEERSMVSATVDDGQSLLALNEVFIGQRTHQSARYRILWGGREERQSSSGVIVTTGTGATGWALSISRQIRQPPPLPKPPDPHLSFFVREPFPSVATGTDLRCGRIGPGEHIELVSEMNRDGVVFGDGIEADRLSLGWGQTVRVEVAERTLRLVA